VGPSTRYACSGQALVRRRRLYPRNSAASLQAGVTSVLVRHHRQRCVLVMLRQVSRLQDLSAGRPGLLHMVGHSLGDGKSEDRTVVVLFCVARAIYYAHERDCLERRDDLAISNKSKRNHYSRYLLRVSAGRVCGTQDCKGRPEYFDAISLAKTFCRIHTNFSESAFVDFVTRT
jgi:hypothetical protein